MESKHTPLFPAWSTHLMNTCDFSHESSRNSRALGSLAAPGGSDTDTDSQTVQIIPQTLPTATGRSPGWISVRRKGYGSFESSPTRNLASGPPSYTKAINIHQPALALLCALMGFPTYMTSRVRLGRSPLAALGYTCSLPAD